MATLERAIRDEARTLLNNRKLRNADIQEWSSGPIEAHDGEIVIQCPTIGCWVAVKTEHDKRPKEGVSAK